MMANELAGRLEHGGKLPLPEEDEVEPLDDGEVARILREMLAHRGLRLGHLAGRPQGTALT